MQTHEVWNPYIENFLTNQTSSGLLVYMFDYKVDLTGIRNRSP